MIRLFLSLFFIGLTADLYAGERNPNIFISESVMEKYTSSRTCVQGFNIAISTKVAFLSHINISSAGSAGTWLNLWDAQRSSNTAHVFVTEIDLIDASANSDWFYDRQLSSGLLYSMQTPDKTACVTFIYRWR